jgi:hypothetical protein
VEYSYWLLLFFQIIIFWTFPLLLILITCTLDLLFLILLCVFSLFFHDSFWVLSYLSSSSLIHSVAFSKTPVLPLSYLKHSKLIVTSVNVTERTGAVILNLGLNLSPCTVQDSQIMLIPSNLIIPPVAVEQVSQLPSTLFCLFVCLTPQDSSSKHTIVMSKQYQAFYKHSLNMCWMNKQYTASLLQEITKLKLEENTNHKFYFKKYQ